MIHRQRILLIFFSKLLWCFGMLGFVLSGPIFAQSIQQNPNHILPDNTINSLPGSSTDISLLDDTSFGFNLSGLVIISDENSVGRFSEVPGITIISENAHLRDAEFEAVLEPFLGLPLSQRLIGEIRDAITQYMRDRNRPLIAVIIPPQEITRGVVQIIVMPFRVANRNVERVETGYETTSEQYVLDTVSILPGQEIASDVLLADLNWLNMNPFRNVGVVFRPGEVVGTTDMVLRISDAKPWQVYAGYTNSGTVATGIDRFYAGIIAAANEQQATYQFTSSPQTILSSGQMSNFANDAAYLAHSVSYFAALPWRHKLTVSADYARTRSDLADPFVADNETGVIRLDYAVPVGGAGIAFDLFGGLEVKRQANNLLFAGNLTNATLIDVVQTVFGVRGNFDNEFIKTDFEIRGTISPGGLTGNNSDSAFIAASANPGDSAQYAYVSANIVNEIELPQGFSFNLALAGQLALNSLPGIERFSMGGVNSVRGYESGERSGDNGLSIRSEIHLPEFSLFDQIALDDTIDLYSFVDYGLVQSKLSGATQALLGAGVGVDMVISNGIQASLVWGHTFLDGSVSSANSNRVHVGLSASY